MSKGLSRSDNVLARYDEPAAAMHVVAAKLASHGFDFHGPDWEEGRRLTVTNLRDTTCEITVEDHGLVVWEYWPEAGNNADPEKITSLVMRLLSDDGVDPAGRRLERTTPTSCLKGLVGCELKGRGLAVCLDVYEDHVAYEVAAEIVVTNPVRPERGQVRVTDDGALMWECGCWDGAGSDTAAVAEKIVSILATDIEDGYVRHDGVALAGSGRGNG